MATLPVREMILYKHGVGFFVREGAISGESVALTFHQDEINDVLKSLAVFDRSGGQVLGIHYQTPMDKAARLANSSIRLSDAASLRDLLRDLRGRRASLVFETTPGTLETVTGRVIGLDEPPKNLANVDPIAGSLVTILGDDGQVRVYRLQALRSVSIQDAQSGSDLQYFLDTSMSEDQRRSVTVRLSSGEHDLAVSYVAPSPTWRVSYRVVAESDKNAETGKALLQGWGLFDNRLDEDLEDVRVTLVAGQPISFIYELYGSRIPARPTVQDESRIAPGPIEYEGGSSDDLVAGLEPMAWLESLAARQGSDKIIAAPAMLAAAAAPAPQRARGLTGGKTVASLEEAERAAPPAAEGKEAGEFFQYAVTTPVSVKRGESALVPIIGAEVKYNRELLYNGAKLPKHPVAALRFANATSLTLERGPVTVVEDGDYKGEAVVPFTKDGNEVYLPYAVELGVKITERPEYRTETTGLSIEGVYLVYEQYNVHQMLYMIENTTAKPLTITVEAPIETGMELFDTRKPDIETASERRWRVEVKARSRAEFTRKERERTRRFEQLRALTYQNLQTFLENRWLDKKTLAQLQEMLDTLASIQRAHAEINTITAERTTLYQKQEQLRANLTTLNTTGQETALRNRMLGQLEGTQNRLEEIDQRVTDLTRQIADNEKRVEQIIAGLS